MSLITVADKHKYSGLAAGIGHGPGAGAAIIDMIIALQEKSNEGFAGTPVAGTGVTIAEANGLRKMTLTLDNAIVELTDDPGVVAYGSLKLVDLPEGVILHMGSVADLDVTKTSAGVNADWDGDVGLGTAAAGAGATLATTEQDLIPTTATPQAVAGATTADGQSTATEVATVFDGTTTAKDVYLNFLVDDADHDVTTTPCNLIVNGAVTITYAVLGDN